MNWACRTFYLGSFLFFASSSFAADGIAPGRVTVRFIPPPKGEREKVQNIFCTGLVALFSYHLGNYARVGELRRPTERFTMKAHLEPLDRLDPDVQWVTIRSWLLPGLARDIRNKLTALVMANVLQEIRPGGLQQGEHAGDAFQQAALDKLEFDGPPMIFTLPYLEDGQRGMLRVSVHLENPTRYLIRVVDPAGRPLSPKMVQHISRIFRFPPLPDGISKTFTKQRKRNTANNGMPYFLAYTDTVFQHLQVENAAETRTRIENRVRAHLAHAAVRQFFETHVQIHNDVYQRVRKELAAPKGPAATSRDELRRIVWAIPGWYNEKRHVIERIDRAWEELKGEAIYIAPQFNDRFYLSFHDRRSRNEIQICADLDFAYTLSDDGRVDFRSTWFRPNKANVRYPDDLRNENPENRISVVVIPRANGEHQAETMNRALAILSEAHAELDSHYIPSDPSLLNVN